MPTSPLGVPDAARVSGDGTLLGPVDTDDVVATRWQGTAVMQDMGDAGVVKCYPKCKVDAFVVHEDDVVYCTASEQGEPCELAVVAGLYVEGKDKMLYLRWLWRASQTEHKLEDAHAREVFLSDSYGPYPMEGIEG